MLKIPFVEFFINSFIFFVSTKKKRHIKNLNKKSLPNSFQPVAIYAYPVAEEDLVMDSAKTCPRIDKVILETV